MQLGILSSNISSGSTQDLNSIIHCKTFLKLRGHCCQKYSLILVMPATNAVSERSLSSLRCLKSYLRSTMIQTRLNNLMVLHVHSNRTDQLCLTKVENEFIQGSTHQKIIFGKFLLAD